MGLDFINVDAIIRHDLYEDNLDSIDASIEALEKEMFRKPMMNTFEVT